MAEMQFPNSPKQLTMQDALSKMSDYGGLAKSCRFAVRINAPRFTTLSTNNTDNLVKDTRILNDLTYLCEAAEMPGRGFVNADVRYYGPNQKLPVLTQYEDTTMTFLCRTDSYERQFFDDWMEYINPTNTFNFNYRKDYETTIEIMQFSEYASGGNARAPQETYRITLFNAYPLLVNPQPMTWADDQLMRIAVTFTYMKWRRVGRDKKLKDTTPLVSTSGVQNIRENGYLTPIDYYPE